MWRLYEQLNYRDTSLTSYFATYETGPHCLCTGWTHLDTFDSQPSAALCLYVNTLISYEVSYLFESRFATLLR